MLTSPKLVGSGENFDIPGTSGAFVTSRGQCILGTSKVWGRGQIFVWQMYVQTLDHWFLAVQYNFTYFIPTEGKKVFSVLSSFAPPLFLFSLNKQLKNSCQQLAHIQILGVIIFPWPPTCLIIFPLTPRCSVGIKSLKKSSYPSVLLFK